MIGITVRTRDSWHKHRFYPAIAPRFLMPPLFDQSVADPAAAGVQDMGEGKGVVDGGGETAYR